MRAVALVVLLAAVPEALAFGCMGNAPPATLAREADECGIVLYAVPVPGGPEGTTSFRIVRALKTHACIAGQAVVTYPRTVNLPAANAPAGYLLLATVKDDAPEFVRIESATPALADYLAGAMRVDYADRGRVLRYAFDHLESTDKAVAAEAHVEFAWSTEADVAKASKHFPADTVRGWLAQDRDPDRRTGLYALLLAGCGTAADAPLVRGRIDKVLADDVATHLDLLLVSYTVLDPKAGGPLLREVTAKADASFNVRYAAFKAVRHLKTAGLGTVPDADLVAVLGLMMQPDFADLAINELGQWKRWDLTDRILELADRKDYQLPIVRRAVLGYALRCPAPAAAAYVAAQRVANPDRVAFCEELLKDEEEAAKKAKKK